MISLGKVSYTNVFLQIEKKPNPEVRKEHHEKKAKKLVMNLKHLIVGEILTVNHYRINENLNLN